jgi:hypothetical protein
VGDTASNVNKIQFRPDRRWELVKYLSFLSAIFGAWMFMARFGLQITSLDHLVAWFKFGSLLVLIAVSGELGRKVSKQSGMLLFHGNRLIVVGSALVLMLLAMKGWQVLSGNDLLEPPNWYMIWETTTKDFFIGLLGWLVQNSWWMSSAPIAAYGILNISALFFSGPVKKDVDLYNLILLYTIFNSGPMVFGLVGAASITWLSSMEDGFKAIFFSGAVGVLLLLSALLSKAIEIMLFDKDADIA